MGIRCLNEAKVFVVLSKKDILDETDYASYNPEA